LVVETSLTENLRSQLLPPHIQAVVTNTSGPIYTSLKTWLWTDERKLPAQSWDDSLWFSLDLCSQALVCVGRPLTFCLDKMVNIAP
jgi:hypothetical protein